MEKENEKDKGEINFLHHSLSELEELKNYKNASLRYAYLLQEAIMQEPETLNDIFPQSFIFNAPKDIVSGDFYWFDQMESKVYVACADCTGHGVPGAMLTILGTSKLHEVAKFFGIRSPSEILDDLNSRIYNALGKKRGPKKMNDGMDMSLFCLDLETKILEYAGANNPLWVIREKKLIELEPDKTSIGMSIERSSFCNKNLKVQDNDMIYIFSDGFADQFGGEKGKKFKYKNFSELLISISEKNISDQINLLDNTLKNWKGKLEQVDDISVIGIRI